VKNLICLSMITVSLLFLAGCGGANQNGDSLNSGDSRVIWSNTQLNLLGGVTLPTLTLTLEATILPPTVSATTLQADDVFVNGNTAYVTYNIEGNTKLGGIDMMNTTVPLLPSRTASTTFTDTAVNGLYVNGSSVYFSGATSNGSNGPAVLDELNLTSNVFSAVQTVSTATSFAGTGVTFWNNSLYSVSGNSGGLSVNNPTTLTQTAYLSISDARGLAAYSATSNDLWVIAGTSGAAYEINSSNSVVNTVQLGGASIAESKSTIQVGNTVVAASIGDGGATVFCQADGVSLVNVPAPIIPGIASTLTVTNAVAMGPGLLFMANGQAGVYVYQVTTSAPSGSFCNSVTATFLGSVSLGSNYSANNVKYSNGTLYVATGLGGFKMINVVLSTPITNALNDL
jgi:hypothetical protein